ncbi:cell surface protein [Exiguobacterium sp. BMC-KP]|uniref:DUF871 domain-containing protein n=1 Tax=Exiguobacterium sp. BMC-KP TaxID=1684312 RepID=UPI0006AA4741|nr:MupG family TIM beta-alpha barrel fold protein [Exiguobacterium sp. BMC-KP]KOP28974.1 cell surface protein [Exiguobacterium sp. BMC-KP]
MKGLSIYLNEPMTDETVEWLQWMRDVGFSSLFTSLHIPEDDSSLYIERLQALGRVAKTLGYELVADIAPASLATLGKTWETAATLTEWGVTGLRLDYGISPQQIATLSNQMMVALNASTLTADELAEMKAHGLQIERTEAWHNFYPRPETGLDRTWFDGKNAWLRAQGLRVQAFIPGDGTLRGPLFETLPTLEDHRKAAPFASYMDLQPTVDRILVGDPRLTDATIRQFEAEQDGVILLRALANGQQARRYTETNRFDPARDVIRSVESRMSPSKMDLTPHDTSARPLGTITIDNERYGRYAGEVQITKCDLSTDERINVLGRVIEEDRPLVTQIGPGQKFRINWVTP